MSSKYTDIVFESLDLTLLNPHDIDTIAGLESELFGPGAWSTETVSQELEAPARTYFVARRISDHDIVAYAGLWFDGDDAQVMTIGVSQLYQGQHIGTHLMSLLIDAARELQANRVLLEVAVDNEPALAVYESAGFERMSIRKRYYQPENKDAYTMAYTINENVNSAHNPIGFVLPQSENVQGDRE